MVIIDMYVRLIITNGWSIGHYFQKRGDEMTQTRVVCYIDSSIRGLMDELAKAYQGKVLFGKVEI